MAETDFLEFIKGLNTKAKAELDHISNKCEDFDEDCKHVDNKVACAIGGLTRCNGKLVGFLEPIKGFCPYLNHEN